MEEKHANWEEMKLPDTGNGSWCYFCTNCNNGIAVKKKSQFKKYKECPKCGAIMDKVVSMQ